MKHFLPLVDRRTMEYLGVFHFNVPVDEFKKKFERVVDLANLNEASVHDPEAIREYIEEHLEEIGVYCEFEHVYGDRGYLEI